MSKVLDTLRYADSHEWVKLEGDIATVGISDYAQHALGNIVYVDMPEVGDEVTAGEEFGAVEPVKAASDLMAPELINQDAYANWIMKVKVSDPSEIDALMDAAAYAKVCEE